MSNEESKMRKRENRELFEVIMTENITKLVSHQPRDPRNPEDISHGKYQNVFMHFVYTAENQGQRKS
jgi:hypothetical protein